MATRPYVSTVRAAAAADTRERLIAAAAAYLRDATSLAGFSLEAVAKAAGVTRLTVYNQFVSRRGLLEAVFDDLARRGRLGRIAEVMASQQPEAGVEQLVEIFCGFWGGDPAVGRLQDAIATDPEFADAVRERNDRRREIIRALVLRLAPGSIGADADDAVDLIYALTGYPVFRTLAAGRSAEATCALIKAACRDALQRIGAQG